jgi:uncharacterized membrane protein YphA (DoxX/SURF4 family)
MVKVGLDELIQRVRRRRSLQRLFSAFPGGPPGIGLLLLRATAGIAGLAEGVLFLIDPNGGGLANWAAGLALTASGLLLLAGFLTPIAGAVMALITLAVGVSWIQPPANLIGEPLTVSFAVIIATAVSLLGPGSFSVDRRIFGRREIIIPRTPHSPK